MDTKCYVVQLDCTHTSVRQVTWGRMASTPRPETYVEIASFPAFSEDDARRQAQNLADDRKRLRGLDACGVAHIWEGREIPKK